MTCRAARLRRNRRRYRRTHRAGGRPQTARALHRHHQILCVSHLPQIASCAQAHFQVAKRVAKGRTLAATSGPQLESNERLEELARLLRQPGHADERPARPRTPRPEPALFRGGTRRKVRRGLPGLTSGGQRGQVKRFRKARHKNPARCGCAPLLFTQLAWRPLWDSVEGRYAEIGREMLELKDWVSPHLNYVLYFEKPPLMYWLVAVSETIFTARTPSPRVSGARCSRCAHRRADVFNRQALEERTRRPWLAGAILGTSLMYMALSQFLALDMALTFWTTLELFAFSRLLSERAPVALPRYVVLAGARCGGRHSREGPRGDHSSGRGAFFDGGVRAARRAAPKNWLGAADRDPLCDRGAVVYSRQSAPSLFPSVLFYPASTSAAFFTSIEQRNQPFYFFHRDDCGGIFTPWSVFLPEGI